jgi:hypothetical protein
MQSVAPELLPRLPLVISNMSDVVSTYDKVFDLRTEQQRVDDGFVVDDEPSTNFFHHFQQPGDGRHRCTDFVATNDFDRLDGESVCAISSCFGF